MCKARGGNHQAPHDMILSPYFYQDTILLGFLTYCEILQYIAIYYLKAIDFVTLVQGSATLPIKRAIFGPK